MSRTRWLAALALGVTAVIASSPPLSISLETSWPAPPIILEILYVIYSVPPALLIQVRETIHDERPSSYFPLLSLFASQLPLWDTDNEISSQSLLSASLALIESYNLLPQPSSLSSFHLGMALHTTVPRIEASYNYYEHRIDEVALGVTECQSWVEWRGKGFCGVDELRKDFQLSLEEKTHLSEGNLALLPFDHLSPSSNPLARAVFYFDPLDASSTQLLTFLEHHASSYPEFQYIVRYRPSKGLRERKTAMAGFGVEMALKKTDYLVVDDRVNAGNSKSTVSTDQHVSNGAGMFSEVLGEDPWSDTSTPIALSELQDIGLQASTLIMASEDKLEALAQLSQDFPKYSAAIARRVIVDPVIAEHSVLMGKRGSQPSAFYINGKTIKDTELNAYSLHKILRSERSLTLSLTSLGLTPKQAFELISDPLVGQAQTEEDPLEGLVDASDRPEEGQVITWWNDMEKDKRYQQWPKHIQGYMRPLHPGQFHQVRRNTWNLVFVLDLGLAPSIDVISGTISSLIQRGVPFHFGIVPMFSPGQEDISSQMAKIFHYSVKTFGRGKTKEFLMEISASTPSSAATPGRIRLETVRKAYEKMAGGSEKSSLPFDEVLATDSSRIQLTGKYLSRLLATPEESEPGHLFINGKHMPMSGQWTMMLQSELGGQLAILQEGIHANLVPDDTSTYFYDLPSTTERRNKLVLPSIGEHKLRIVNLLEVFSADPTKRLASDFVYASNGRGSPLTIWIVGDLDSSEALPVVKDALAHLMTPECASRLGFVHVPSASSANSGKEEGYRLSTILYQLLIEKGLSLTSPADLLALIEELETTEDNLDRDGTIVAEGKDSPKTFQSLPLNTFSSAGWSAADTAAAAEFWKIGGVVAGELGISSSKPHILINGRVIGPLTSSHFGVEDFDTLEIYELSKRVKPVIDVLRTMYDDITVFDRPTLANLISMASSVVATGYKPSDLEGIFNPLPASRNRFYENLDQGCLSFTLGDTENAIIHVAAVVNPVSEEAQRWSDLLKMLSEMDNVAIRVHLNPDPRSKEIKLKRFYRSSLPSKLQFDVDGNDIAPAVTFKNLPSTPIFTLGMDTPPSWITSPMESPFDLDNLLLGDIQQPVDVLFQLKQLVIEGHAREANNAPPRGLQLQLSTNTTQAVSDTQVMANLGYFQFKATPGVYELGIRPGRGQEVYQLDSVGNDGWESASVEQTGRVITLDSFEGVTIFPRFSRRPGMELADVLEVKSDTGKTTGVSSMFKKVKSLVGMSSASTTVIAKKQADINIFTVASGLLYEENFLSPTFLAFIPHLAEEYGFEYELVTYKWPSWLQAQTEKQRIIWAYKILFLDVLFPMDLDKVIFVDADQIVRTDMKELVDVDLHGRVYGMAPMGDDREEMEGFRFWKTGYWKDALRGRPYHISALYVVDLKRFRQLATGDRLRGQYHALSQDPNSLANLDQDLPNSMQDSIPIFTLDKSWLWCQTWCSDESLATAKTIDLCQNPLTKEPKLVRARQIPEWDVYDKEVAAFASKLYAHGGALGISVDDLAAESVASREGVVEVEAEEGSQRIEDEL
ncbi:UDP-glucose:glycoprotein glucosyltransferase, partial [Tremellales sp. Uapishka_1]